MAVKYINGALQQGPGLRIRKSGKATEKTIELNGQWSLVEAAVPQIGAMVAGYPGYQVVDADAKRTNGSYGKLVVTLRRGGDPDPNQNADDQALSDRVSVRWVKSQRALHDSAYFVAGSDSDAKVSQIECWRREKDHALRDAYKFRAPVLYGTTVVQWETFEITDAKTLALAKKIKAGQTGYWWWYPVVRRRREYDYPPEPDLTFPTILTAASLANRVGQPRKYHRTSGTTLVARKKIPLSGSEKDPGGTMTSFAYKYLLVGMEVDEADDNRFMLTEEWLGAKAFDSDFYGT